MSIAPSEAVRRFFWTHPEWWSIVLVVLAWGFVIRHATVGSAHHGHVRQISSFQAEFFNWGLMVVAMMAPLMLEPLRWVAFRSYYHRRHRAIFFFLLGFLLLWMLVGSVATWLRTFDWSHSPLVAPAMFGLAAFWALAPLRTRALVFCHWTAPLAPSGWHANRDCLRFGLYIGASCVVTCYFLMMACALTNHNLVAMLGGTILGVMERRSFRPPTRRIFAGALLLAVWFLLPIREQVLLFW